MYTNYMNPSKQTEAAAQSNEMSRPPFSVYANKKNANKANVTE